MPIIVTCECGKSFQAQEQHVGLQAKCKACGRVLIISGQQVQLAAAPVAVQPIANQVAPQAVPVQNFAASAQPYDATPEGADEINPQAAAVLLQREMQAAADKKFMMTMAFVAFGLMALGGIAAGIYSMTSEPPKKVAKAPEPETPKPTPPVKVDTPKPVEQPKPAKPAFDKSAMGGTAARQVKWSGVIANGLAEDGALLVTLRSEELQSGSTATYRAKLKLKQKLDAPLPSGTEIVFDGVLQPGMQQTTDFRQAADGTRLVDAVYIMTINDGVIEGKSDGTATATPTPAPGKDEVENYFQKAISSKDGHMKKNAEMFHPGDERLGFQGVYRPIPKDAAEKVHNKTDPIATMEDMDAGPEPTPQSDQIEARMLMDPDLVGDGLWLDADSGKSKFFVFLSEPTTIMQEVQQKYGPPGKSIKSGKCRLNFYGRMMLVEFEGRVFSVLRKLVWAK